MDPSTLISALMGNGGVANMQPSAMGNYQQQMGDYMNNLQPSAMPAQPQPQQFAPQMLGYGNQQGQQGQQMQGQQIPGMYAQGMGGM